MSLIFSLVTRGLTSVAADYHELLAHSRTFGAGIANTVLATESRARGRTYGHLCCSIENVLCQEEPIVQLVY